MREEREKYMRLALYEAECALKQGEVPVGCVIVRDGEVIAAAHNRREGQHDATAHAEIAAIREACAKLGTWRLCGCTLYVTLEPCMMCAGAIYNARIGTVVFGLRDREAGAMGGVIDIFQEDFSFSPRVYGGVLAGESETLLKDFFSKLRNISLPIDTGV